MTESTTLWKQLAQKQLVQGEAPEDPEVSSPWYVRFILGFSAWISAAFILGIVITGFSALVDSAESALIAGLIMVLIAFFMLKSARGDFLEQFALALSFAGQVMVVIALGDEQSYYNSRIYIILFIFQSLLAALMPNTIHRFVSAFFMAVAFTLVLNLHGAHMLGTGILLAVCAFLWLNEFRLASWYSRLIPIAYGITLALMYNSISRLSQHYLAFISGIARPAPNHLLPWAGKILIALVMLGVIWQLLKRNRVQLTGKTAIMAYLGGIVIALFSVKASGIMVGAVLLLLGYANANPVLSTLGISSLLYFISVYYYSLHNTLLEKSGLLAALGIFLLTASWLLSRIYPVHNEKARATDMEDNS